MERKVDMDHEAYEQQMIDAVNRNAEEKSKQFKTGTPAGKVITKWDKTTLMIGLIRTLFALVTAAMFALSVIGFVAVATTPGYLAVALFIASLVALGCVFVFIYAQGIFCTESKGDDK